MADFFGVCGHNIVLIATTKTRIATTTMTTINIGRRLFASTSRTLSTELLDSTRPIPSSQLPLSLQTYIKSHIQRTYLPDDVLPDRIPILNPFISHRIELLPTSSIAPGTPRVIHIPPQFSRRRQLQLAQDYQVGSIPPSPYLPVNHDIKVEYAQGKIVQFIGVVERAVKKGVYGDRKRMFRGHKHERQAAGRKKETEERLEGMEKRVTEWKKVCLC